MKAAPSLYVPAPPTPSSWPPKPSGSGIASMSSILNVLHTWPTWPPLLVDATLVIHVLCAHSPGPTCVEQHHAVGSRNALYHQDRLCNARARDDCFLSFRQDLMCHQHEHTLARQWMWKDKISKVPSRHPHPATALQQPKEFAQIDTRNPRGLHPFLQ